MLSPTFDGRMLSPTFGKGLPFLFSTSEHALGVILDKNHLLPPNFSFKVSCFMSELQACLNKLSDDDQIVNPLK